MIKKFHPTLNQEKFNQFSQSDQGLIIASELARARTWAIKGDKKKIRDCLDRALELIDLAIASSAWKNQLKDLLYFRDSLASIYEDPPTSLIYDLFYEKIIRVS